MLFSDRSLWTMLHGLVLSGGALTLLLVAAAPLIATAGAAAQHDHRVEAP
jgi:hypothetical protein